MYPFLYKKYIYLDVHFSQVQIDRATTIFKIVAERISEHVNREQVILAIVYQFVCTATWEVKVAAVESLDMWSPRETQFRLVHGTAGN